MSIVTLSRPLSSFGFVERERKNGKPLHFKCGRDFLYYALNFYFPEKFNPTTNNPIEIDRKRLFGITIPKYLAWSQLQFLTVPAFLKSQGLTLYINNKEIASFVSFGLGNLLSRISYEGAIESIEECVDKNIACGIDIPIERRLFTLLDHVMFVYGYDNENLYVLDTLTVPKLEYEKIHPSFHYFKLPKKIIKKNWSIFGRVWRVEKNA